MTCRQIRLRVIFVCPNKTEISLNLQLHQCVAADLSHSSAIDRRELLPTRCNGLEPSPLGDRDQLNWYF
jgi:hypothetical protein